MTLPTLSAVAPGTDVNTAEYVDVASVAESAVVAMDVLKV